MKWILSLLFLCSTSILFSQGAFHKQSYYNTLAAAKAKDIGVQLEAVTSLSGNDRLAYEGALEMRKAGTLSVPAKKLAIFKQGHKKLEAAIAADPNNLEYLFLRLIIQENAPKALGYNKNIKYDSDFIRANYKKLPSSLQQILLNYSTTSKALKGTI